MNSWAILLAAGKSSRLAVNGLATPKQFLLLDGSPLFWKSALTMAHNALLRGIIFVMPPEDTLPGSAPESTLIAKYSAYIQELESTLPGKRLGIPWKVALGGPLRQDSVMNGLSLLPQECQTVLVHDAARPFASPTLYSRVLTALLQDHIAVIPGIPVSDTIKAVTPASLERPVSFSRNQAEDSSPHALQAEDNMRSSTLSPVMKVHTTYERSTLRAIQTPQGFQVAALKKAHARAASEGWEVTDDAALLERVGMPVLVVEGEEDNTKITTPGDLSLLYTREAHPMPQRIPCTGFGYDVHRYGGTRPYILGGVPIPCDIAVAAHSDGDTLLHALMDALLGCICGGDIGRLFPDSDPAYEGISSGVLLAEVRELYLRRGLEIYHVDITVIAQAPRIAPHAKEIAANIAKLLHISPSRINVKATTEERLGFTGEKKGVKVIAVVTGSLPPE